MNLDNESRIFIGMPVYNCDQYITAALDSILGQSFKGWNLLISDNFSTDNTGEIAQRYAASDARITYIKQDNNIGAINNFQFLVNQADSEFFMWAAADDEWSENYISECINVLYNNSDIQFVSGAVVNTDIRGNQVRRHYPFNIYASKWTCQRLFKYLISKEVDGKANIIYSVYRTEFCKLLFNTPKIFEGWGSDMAFVCSGLARGRYQFVGQAVLYKRLVTEADVATGLNIANGRYDLTQCHGNFPPEYFKEYLSVLVAGVPNFFYRVLIKLVMNYRYILLELKDNKVMGVNDLKKMRHILQRVFKLMGLNRSEVTQLPKKDTLWADAQKYELDNAIYVMHSEHFKVVIDTYTNPMNSVSTGYVNKTTIKEFFGDDLTRWQDFVKHITGKVVLEIGACTASQLSLWDVASERYVIDPLYNQIVDYQHKEFGKTAFLNLHGFSLPAETLVESLVNKVDGALLIRNCIDHSPLWPFILSNIVEYMTKGSYLLIWNDLYHPPGYEDGHYDITDNVDEFRRLISNMGFNILIDYQNEDSPCVNFGCLAIKK